MGRRRVASPYRVAVLRACERMRCSRTGVQELAAEADRLREQLEGSLREAQQASTEHQREEKEAQTRLLALQAKVDKQDAEALATRAELAAARAKEEAQQLLLSKFESDVTKLEIKLGVAEQEKKAQVALEQEVWTLQRQLAQLKDVETKLAEEKGARSEMEVEIGRLQSCLTLHSDGTQYVGSAAT